MLAVEAITVPDRLHGITAAFQPGKVTAICGPNGAGKSSLLSALAGLLEPASGAVMLDGNRLDHLPLAERAQAMGYLPQSAEVAWDVSAETLVALGRIPWRGAPAGKAGEAIEQAIATMDVGPLRHRPVSRLSGGERARVLMARVLAGKPRWILADEPLANLDLAHAAALVARFREQAAQGVGVVLVLHDLAQAMNHADEVLVLAEGALAASGMAEQALAAPVIERVWGVKARWLGEPGQRALLTA
jgi:iron complex transport system ATP-binding protein